MEVKRLKSELEKETLELINSSYGVHGFCPDCGDLCHLTAAGGILKHRLKYCRNRRDFSLVVL